MRRTWPAPPVPNRGPGTGPPGRGRGRPPPGRRPAAGPAVEPGEVGGRRAAGSRRPAGAREQVREQLPVLVQPGQQGVEPVGAVPQRRGMGLTPTWLAPSHTADENRARSSTASARRSRGRPSARRGSSPWTRTSADGVLGSGDGQVRHEVGSRRTSCAWISSVTTRTSYWSARAPRRPSSRGCAPLRSGCAGCRAGTPPAHRPALERLPQHGEVEPVVRREVPPRPAVRVLDELVVRRVRRTGHHRRVAGIGEPLSTSMIPSITSGTTTVRSIAMSSQPHRAAANPARASAYPVPDT